MYSIHIVPTEVFDKIPHEERNGSDVSDSLGFANPRTGKAFVRDTNIPELNKYLIDHELEHLLEEHKTDVDANGICHKKGGFFRQLASLISPILAPLAENVINPQKYGTNQLGNEFNQIGSNIGAAAQGGAQGFLSGNPISGTIGATLGATQNQQNALNSSKSLAPASYQGPQNMDSMFQSGGQSGGIPQVSQASLGQGFGQAGSPGPSSLGGPQGGAGTPMSNVGLGAGIPNQGIPQGANIQMGQGAQSPEQSGFWFPQYKF